MINGESRVHMCRSTRICEGVIHFFQIFTHLSDQIFGQFMPKNFLQERLRITLLGVTAQKDLLVIFCKHCLSFFEVKQPWPKFFLDFLEF